MSATAGEEVRQQIADLVRRGAFKPIARYLPADQSEERLAEATALTLAMALRYAERGQRLPDAILVHHARLRAVEFKRHLVSSKGRGLDALCQRNYLKGEVEILHLDGVVDDVGGEGDQELIGMAMRKRADPADALASAFDLRRWLDALSARDRRLLSLRASGFSLQEIGTKMGLSISQVFARCKQLGVELAEAAEITLPKKTSRSSCTDERGAEATFTH